MIRSSFLMLLVVAVPVAADTPAPFAEVQTLLKEIDTPILRGQPLPVPRDQFTIEALKPYQADELAADASPLRTAARQAADKINAWRTKKELRLPEELRSPITAANKKAVLTQQRGPAAALADLDELTALFTDAGTMRYKEKSPRWQAQFDLMHSRLLLSQVAIHELNLMYGNVRRDALPELNPLDDHNGWRLTPTAKLQSGLEIRNMAKEAAKIQDRILKAHPNTPWAALVEHDRQQLLGLEWRATRLAPKK